MKLEDIKVKSNSFLLSGDRIFYTVQGEGDSIGKPAIFMRLHMCNLHCKWCDTKYTWDKTMPEYKTEPWRFNYVGIIKELDKYDCLRLIITGGEPLLHKLAIDDLLDFVKGYDVEIETNGTIMPTEKMISSGVQFNCSPKLSNSGNELELRYRPEVLKAMNELHKTTFKFVVSHKSDLIEVENIIKDCGLNSEKIILMPEGINQDDIKKHALEVVDLCKEKGWRLLPRLQVMLWGHQRAI